MKPKPAFVRADGTIELYTVTVIGMIIAFIVLPGDKKADHALRFHHTREEILLLIFGIGGASGKSKYAVITITDTMLAKAGYDRVCVKTTKVTSSTVTGAIYAVQTKPRYLE